MNFNPFPEEQDHSELISRLQEIYRMTPEDKASLAHIQARLFPAAPLQLQELSPSQPGEPAPSQNGHIAPHPFEPPHSKKVWVRRLNLLAAVLVVLLLTGATVSTSLLVAGKSRPAVGGKPTLPSQPILAVQPTLVPAEPRTLLGKGTWLSRQGIFLATSQVGWAFPDQTGMGTGPVFRTIDGGTSWKQVVLPQELLGQRFDVYAFDATMAFVLSLGTQGDPQSFFYRTLDGGVTWQRGNWPPLPPATAYNSGATFFDWTFLDHLQGWVSVLKMTCCGGDARDSTLSQLGGQTLFHTTDGGLTWRRVSRLPLKYPGRQLTFTNAHTGWLITLIDDPAHPGLADPQSFPAALYVTHDGGSTWNQQPLPAPPLESAKADYENLTFFTASKGYLFNGVRRQNGLGEAYLYMTQDGGNSWQIRGAAIPSDGLSVVNDRYTFDATTLFTLANGQWVSVSKPPPGGDTTRVEFLSSLVGVALVSGTEVYGTTDGGKTWQLIGTLPRGA